MEMHLWVAHQCQWNRSTLKELENPSLFSSKQEQMWKGIRALTDKVQMILPHPSLLSWSRVPLCVRSVGERTRTGPIVKVLWLRSSATKWHTRCTLHSFWLAIRLVEQRSNTIMNSLLCLVRHYSIDCTPARNPQLDWLFRISHWLEPLIQQATFQ